MITIKKIQNLLLTHPIYNWMNNDKKSVEILVIGEGEFAESFVDECMQLVQVLGKELVIYWCTDEAGVKEKYLSKRPALHEFVNIDDELKNSGLEVYCSLIFAESQDIKTDKSKDLKYVFVSTNDDDNNIAIAKSYKEEADGDILTAYVVDEEIHVYALDEREEREQYDVFKLIESEEVLDEMAFNTHFIWEGTGNIDIENAKKRFYDDEYNQASSREFVLSIPYKLASLGIKFSSLDDAIEKLTKSEDYSKYMAVLAYLEHRRWVISLLTSGYSPMKFDDGKVSYQSCIDRKSVKDKKNKIHPCLVRSSVETPLSSGIYSENKKLWDKPSDEDKNLDELDLFSVSIHREMLNSAKKLKKDTAERQDLIDHIEDLKSIVCPERTGVVSFVTLSEEDRIIRKNFDRYVFCIKNIVDKSLPYSVQFETYERDLLSCVTDIDAINLISDIRSIMFPALEACLYRDYKKYDMDFVERLPFILSYRKEPTIGIVFNVVDGVTNTNQDMFKNVASATALYAKKIYYICRITEKTNLKLLTSKITELRNYFVYRGFDEILAFRVYFDSVCEKTEKEAGKVFEKLLDKDIIDEYSTLRADFNEIVSDAKEWVSDCDYYDGVNQISESAFENAIFTREIIDSKIRYFEFDSKNRKFVNKVNSELLDFVPLSSFIQVEDMFALMKAEDKEFNYQDYSDTYLDYWNVYSGNEIDIPQISNENKKFAYCAMCWTQVCKILQGKNVTNRRIELNSNSVNEYGPLQAEVIVKMLNKLKEKGIIKTLNITGSGLNRTVSATFTSAKAKAMFDKAGDVLETYVYFEACKQSWFDDIQTGYKFKWEKGEVVNELDCVLTKGYSSIFVECKSVIAAEEGFYLTLDSLANKFGINCKKVLIMVIDTNPDNEDKKKAYKNYVSRGNQLDIVTLSTKHDLDNIGVKLREIMNS